jgi:hypothetical protein
MIVVSKIDIPYHLTKGKTYILERTPKMIDPITYDEVIGYICKGDNGNYFRTNMDDFIELQKIRDQKLTDLGL